VPWESLTKRTDQLLRVTENALARAIGAAREEQGALATSALKLRMKRAAFGLSVGTMNSLDTGLDETMHEEPQIPNYGKRGSGSEVESWMTLAIEPMINIGTSDVRLLDDGWTVRTADGMPSAHSSTRF